jgi:hypothetical protein
MVQIPKSHAKCFIKNKQNGLPLQCAISPFFALAQPLLPVSPASSHLNSLHFTFGPDQSTDLYRDFKHKYSFFTNFTYESS